MMQHFQRSPAENALSAPRPVPVSGESLDRLGPWLFRIADFQLPVRFLPSGRLYLAARDPWQRLPGKGEIYCISSETLRQQAE